MRRKAVAVSLLLAIVPLVAGCVADPRSLDDEEPHKDPPLYQVYDLAELTYVDHDPLAAHTDTSHDHADPAQHEGAHNIEAITHVPPEEGQRITELDIVGDYLYQCSGSGFRIINISVPELPQVVSIYSGGTNCADVKVTDDGAYAIVMGREIVDVRNKEDPRMVVEDTGAFCHMCYIKRIGDAEYVFLARDQPHEVPFGSGVGIYTLTRDPVGMTKVSHFIVPPEDRINTHMVDGDQFAHQVHDMTVYDDPLLNRTIMLAAYWDLGVRVVDVTDPAYPTDIGAWDDFNGDLGDIHTVGVDFIDGRRIIAAATENGAIIDPVGSATGYSAGYVYLLDASDLDDIQTLGKWINPGKHASGPEAVGVYSMHNIQFLEGRVYVAHYHAGVWIIDAEGYVLNATVDAMRTLQKQDEVPSWGYYFTTADGLSPNVWDVAVKDGFLYASDIGNGLHVLRFLGDPAGDPTFTSIA